MEMLEELTPFSGIHHVPYRRGLTKVDGEKSSLKLQMDMDCGVFTHLCRTSCW